MSRQTNNQKNFLIVFGIGFGLQFVSFLLDLTETDGANIGAGILFMIGGLLILAGLVGLAFSAKKTWVKISVILVLVAGLGASVLGFQNSEDEADRVYCEAVYARGDTPVEGDEFCERFDLN